MKVDKPEFVKDEPPSAATATKLPLTSCVYDPAIWLTIDKRSGDALVVVGDKSKDSGQYVSAKGLKELAVKLYHLGLWLEQENASR